MSKQLRLLKNILLAGTVMLASTATWAAEH